MIGRTKNQEPEEGSPSVSVVMSVYNGERYLREAVESVLGQTFTNFEFIIIDDGSTDGTAEILDSYDDGRLIILRQENIGLTKALNRGLKVATGKYIARQDADDISHHERLSKQASFLDKKPDIALVGCQINYIDGDGDIIGSDEYATDPKMIAERLPYENQFCHGSIMFRREAISAIKGYREVFRFSQDYDLVLRLSGKHQLANMPERLFGHRLNGEMVSVKHREEQIYFGMLARKLWRQREQEGKDALDMGEAITGFTPGVDVIDKFHYQRLIIYLCLRHGELQKARREILTLIRHEPFRARGYLHLALTFMGWMTPKFLKLWGKARYGDKKL